MQKGKLERKKKKRTETRRKEGEQGKEKKTSRASDEKDCTVLMKISTCSS